MTAQQQDRHKELINLLNKCTEAASTAHDDRELFQSVCHILASSGFFQLAWFGYADESAQKIVGPHVHSEGYGSFFEDLEAALRQADYEDPSNVAIESGAVCWIKYLRDHPALAPIQSAALESGCTSVISVPVIWDDRPRGALTLYYSDPERVAQPAVDLLRDWFSYIRAVLTQWIPAPHLSPKGHEAELRTLLDVVPQHITLLTGDGRVLYYNRVALNYYGHTLAEMQSPESHLDINHPEELERVIKEYTAGLISGISFGLENRLRRHDGQFRWFSAQLTPLEDEHGRII